MLYFLFHVILFNYCHLHIYMFYFVLMLLEFNKCLCWQMAMSYVRLFAVHLSIRVSRPWPVGECQHRALVDVLYRHSSGIYRIVEQADRLRRDMTNLLLSSVLVLAFEGFASRLAGILTRCLASRSRRSATPTFSRRSSHLPNDRRWSLLSLCRPS